MTDKNILNRIDLFRRELQRLVTKLKAISHDYFFQLKKPEDILTDICEVRTIFRAQSEDILNRNEFIDLPVTDRFCEASDIIENLQTDAEEAMENSQESKVPGSFSVYLSDAENRLSVICDNLSDFVKDERNTPKPPKQQPPKQVTTLKSFIEIHCDLSGKPDIQSKVDLLHEYNRKRPEDKLALPPLAKPYKKGQHKYYFTANLIKNWPAYVKEMPTLPPLKSGG